MKKLLLINWRDINNPEAGGAEIYYHEIFKRIAVKGVSVTVLSHHFGNAPREEMIDGITVLRKGGKFLFNYQIIPWLMKNHRNYDLVIEDLNKIPFFTPLYVKHPRLHLAMHFFDTEIFREALFPLALYVYLMEKLAAKVYHKERFIAISESTAADIEKFPIPRSRIEIVEPGIDTVYYTPVLQKKNPPTIAYIGRLMKYKNVQFLIRALPRLREQVPDLTLEVGGSGDYLPELQRIAKECGVSDAVLFAGQISNDEKRELLSRATLFTNPSAKEGWGINNIEANLCGTISLSSNVAGLRDSVRDGVTGLLYRPDDLDDFCEKAIRLLTDHDLRRTMEKTAREKALLYDWDTMADRMMTFLG